MRWAWVQLTPHGFAVAFIVLWQVKQIGVVPLVLFTLWFPEVTLLKQSELCRSRGAGGGSPRTASQSCRRGT
ncbi:MAG: hypothetical protein ACJ79H_06995 [Myxococcales bacterium]